MFKLTARNIGRGAVTIYPITPAEYVLTDGASYTGTFTDARTAEMEGSPGTFAISDKVKAGPDPAIVPPAPPREQRNFMAGSFKDKATEHDVSAPKAKDVPPKPKDFSGRR